MIVMLLMIEERCVSFWMDQLYVMFYVCPYVVLWHATLFVFWDFVGSDPIFDMLLYSNVLHTYMQYIYVCI